MIAVNTHIRGLISAMWSHWVMAGMFEAWKDMIMKGARMINKGIIDIEHIES
jgi:hypothetical protein